MEFEGIVKTGFTRRDIRLEFDDYTKGLELIKYLIQGTYEFTVKFAVFPETDANNEDVRMYIFLNEKEWNEIKEV